MTAYEEGYQAFFNGHHVCPYSNEYNEDVQDYRDWNDGWSAAYLDDEGLTPNGKTFFNEGYQAFFQGVDGITENPYDHILSYSNHRIWYDGWVAAWKDHRKLVGLNIEKPTQYICRLSQVDI